MKKQKHILFVLSGTLDTQIYKHNDTILMSKSKPIEFTLASSGNFVISENRYQPLPSTPIIPAEDWRTETHLHNLKIMYLQIITLYYLESEDITICLFTHYKPKKEFIVMLLTRLSHLFFFWGVSTKKQSNKQTF